MENNRVGSLHDFRLKSDFKYYVENKLHIPLEGTPFNITKKHMEIIGLVMDNPFSSIMAYRGFGKSKFISFCYIIWRADMWNESAVILSYNEELAMQKLDDIRVSIEFDNPNLANLSGKGIDGITWNRGEIWLVEKEGKDVKRIKAKIYAKGIGSTFRGIHVHNIVGDDIVVEGNSLTFEMREKLERQFLGAALGMRLAKGNTHVILVGTPQHEEDLMCKTSDPDNKEWASILVPVLDPATNLPMCPDLHDLIWIEQQQKMVGPKIFKQEYLLTPISLGKSFFNQTLIDESKLFNETMKLSYSKGVDETIIIGVDYAVIEDKEHAEKNDNDYFAICALRYNSKTGQKRILNLYRERGVSKLAQLKTTEQWAILYGADFVALEFHAFLSWARQDLSKDLEGKLIDTGSKKNKMDIGSGIPSLQFSFEKKQYEIPYGDDYSRTMADILFGELKGLNKADHDDVADSVLRADQVVENFNSGKVVYDKTFSIYKVSRNSVLEEKKKLSSVFGND